MSNSLFNVPSAYNEEVLTYKKSSLERQQIETELKEQSSTVVDIPLIIAGEEIFTEGRLSLSAPHDHKHILANVSQATAEHAKMAIAAAKDARESWSRLDWDARAAVFLKAADLLSTKWRAKINVATMLGQSKNIHQAEIDSVCELIDFWRFNAVFMQDIYSEQPISSPGIWNKSVARGLEGFVCAISPFNFTSIALNLASAPALMGCVAVWKPSHTSMLGSYYGMKLLEEAGLPKGVINFLPGDPKDISDTLLKSEDLSGVHFTGSTKTFNTIWKTIGTNIENYKTYPRIVGETGGKDFIFAHKSANPAELVTACIRGAFEYQGQKCSAASRAYIPRSIWDQMKDDLVSQTQNITMGDVSDFSNFMCAVIDKVAFGKITSYIEHCKNSKDAKIIAGGEYDASKGYYIRPTIIEASDPKYKSMCEEIFGPVLSVYVYEDDQLEETLTLCDTSSPYALTGAIFAKDRLVVDKLTQRLENCAGNFYINDKPTGAVVGQQPFGGARASGTNDKAGSKLNLTRWVSQRTIKENFVAPTDYEYPHMKG